MSHIIPMKAHLTGEMAKFMEKHSGQKVFKKVLGNLDKRKKEINKKNKLRE